MTKDELNSAVAEVKTGTHDALALLYGELNKGQRKKVLKNEAVKLLLERYDILETND